MARTSEATKLAKYRGMRDFARTSEPRGDDVRARETFSVPASFVVQKHAARRLHYDFRLEHEGVLLSWSVPKGPSLSPSEKRLAVRTEDHPLDYADFEGVIPRGQYGGGTVAVWDRGRWEPERDVATMLADGRLTFTLHGDKLRGRWHLIKTRPQGSRESWLLFKGDDDEARRRDEEIVDERPESVLSGRIVEDIAAAPERTWSSRPAAPTVLEKRAARIAERGATPSQLQALVGQLRLGFELTNLDKVLYPEDGITKGELIAYLAVVAEWMLPHVADRPLTLVRCPHGCGHRCFYQKKLLPGSPPPIRTVEITEQGGETVDYMTVHDMPGLVGLAQLGTLEIHTWGARADRTDRPDLAVFDLDPDEALPWDRVARAAIELRGRLADLGLTSFVKTTGGKGLHVAVPIRRRIAWDDFKELTRRIVGGMARDTPSLYTTNMSKRARAGKIFLDYLRNGRGATFVAPYSPRARAGAPVAVPLGWEELARGVDPATFTIHTVPRRLGRLGEDPWREIFAVGQSITRATWRAVGRRDHR